MILSRTFEWEKYITVEISLMLLKIHNLEFFSTEIVHIYIIYAHLSMWNWQRCENKSIKSDHLLTLHNLTKHRTQKADEHWCGVNYFCPYSIMGISMRPLMMVIIECHLYSTQTYQPPLANVMIICHTIHFSAHCASVHTRRTDNRIIIYGQHKPPYFVSKHSVQLYIIA